MADQLEATVGIGNRLVGLGLDLFGVLVIVGGLAWAVSRVLAGLVLIRTLLSWTLMLEIEWRWPWQPARASPGSPAHLPAANHRPTSPPAVGAAPVIGGPG